jgi:hypothetical protein
MFQQRPEGVLSRPAQQRKDFMSIWLWILIIILVLALLGFFGRGRFSR